MQVEVQCVAPYFLMPGSQRFFLGPAPSHNISWNNGILNSRIDQNAIQIDPSATVWIMYEQQSPMFIVHCLSFFSNHGRQQKTKMKTSDEYLHYADGIHCSAGVSNYNKAQV